jgi:hypothetical protein
MLPDTTDNRTFLDSMQILIVGHVCIDRNVTEHATFVVVPYGSDFIPYSKKLSLYPPYPLNISTMVYENTVHGATRIQKCFHYKEAVPVVIDDTMIRTIKQADIVCLAPLAPSYDTKYVRSLKAHMRPDAIFALLPQGYFREFSPDHTVGIRDFTEADGILPSVDIVIMSQQDHDDMHALAALWAEQYHCIAVVTQAECGATVYSGTSILQVPTSPVPLDRIVSSIGAGDIFSAAFLYRYKKSNDLRSSVGYANKIARQGLFATADTLKIDAAV